MTLAFTVCSPDPYVTVQILGTPNGTKKTRHVPNTSDPEWNETLDFYIDPKRDRLIGKSNLNTANILTIFNAAFCSVKYVCHYNLAVHITHQNSN